MKPKQRTDKASREMARRIRDSQWAFMEKVERFDTIWFCPWNKRRRDEGPDEVRTDMMGGMQLFDWINVHGDWFTVGDWDDDRDAHPVRLTEAGNSALSDRDQHDLEPVNGGLVEPGWQATPLPREAVSREQG